MIFSIGYPPAGHNTRNSLPTTAFISGMGWTKGGPEKKRTGKLIISETKSTPHYKYDYYMLEDVLVLVLLHVPYMLEILQVL